MAKVTLQYAIGQNCQKKQSEGVCFLLFGTQNTVTYFQKYTQLQTAFWAILPTGILQID